MCWGIFMLPWQICALLPKRCSTRQWAIKSWIGFWVFFFVPSLHQKPFSSLRIDTFMYITLHTRCWCKIYNYLLIYFGRWAYISWLVDIFPAEIMHNVDIIKEKRKCSFVHCSSFTRKHKRMQNGHSRYME